MLFKFSLLMALLVVGLVLGSVPKLKRPTTPKIHRLEQQSEILSAQNPATTQICFGYYGPILNGVSTKYETDYSLCAETFENFSHGIYCNWNSTLYELASDGDYACDTFADCSTIVDYLEAFECFARVGAQESKAMYAISANATEASTSIHMQLQALENSLDICQNEAERHFVEDTTNTYENLNGCLNGDRLPDASEPANTTPGYLTTW
ncbi:uncharacterized protein LOC111076652 [Drosophila obscura]|uniref:uncharacterized protein LOC111076652 n=1 Tax=Drosophila obscura TaxID=7282 RepID=UPI001BB186D6|nr:uncharacterized protein LOC111076652 [Drosophila obscura]